MLIRDEDKSFALSEPRYVQSPIAFNLDQLSFNGRQGSDGNLYTKGVITVNFYLFELDNSTQQRKADIADDATLVAVARSGDASAFVELSKRHSRRVLHKIYRITNNWQDAGDVLQES